ncbi:MAG: IS66 family insertion sequence element accessory protein TnpA [Pirellulaceae bacterium]
MARKVNLELRETWRQRIERQRGSGRTVSEFSRQEGVSTASFYRWQQKVGAVPAARTKSTAHRRPAKTTVPIGKTVSPVRTDATFVQLPLASAPTNPWIELMLTDGTLIRLPQQNLAALQVVLHACDGAQRAPVPGATRHV